MTTTDPEAVDRFRQTLLDKLIHHRGVGPAFADTNDWYHALAIAVRQELMEHWLQSLEAQLGSEAKFVCYLSAEYLLGRQLDKDLLYTDLEARARAALTDLGVDLDDLRDSEVEPGLGNGGLGRLAACFIDSLARLQIPATGYGIRYEFGIFRQTFVDGWQVERPDDWLMLGNPWEFPHPEMAVTIGFGGRVEGSDGGRRWTPARTVKAVPYNTMVAGIGTSTVNTLRLWAAKATEDFDLEIFNAGDYTQAVRAKIESENITKVLYPDDSTPQGKRLRLEQQFFFTSASLQDIIRMLGDGVDLRRLPDRVALQLNDTHPAVAVAELMRLLHDVNGLGWDEAWDVTRRVCNYTCHTLLPEALEVWPVSLFEELLPRHLEIIYEINARFLDEIRARYPGDEARVQRMSIVQEEGERSVRMAYLATVGSSKVNGVAELQSDLLRRTVLRDFAELWPDRFTNVTNGVTPRRFMRLANPGLAGLITEALGTEEWIVDLDRLEDLVPLAEDRGFRDAWRAVKHKNKEALTGILADQVEVAVSVEAMFDVMIKRLHEYKRQLLKVLHVITVYHRIKDDPSLDVVPRVALFGAKAAPGYVMAKRIIKLINSVGSVVNTDPDVAGRLQVAFPPNYNVSLAERIIPAAELSEQISLAGKEASGTGNMKLSLNGALTIGTLDGANIEIRDLVGPENFFLFGLTVDEVRSVVDAGYRPRDHYEANPALARAIDAIASGSFSGGDREVFRPLVEDMLDIDRFLVLADYAAYVATQDEVDGAYRDQDRWTTMSILNTARCGFFSSDRSIRDYLDRIWHADPVDVGAWHGARGGWDPAGAG